MTRESYVTLAMNDAYCIGALVLGASIRQTQTAKELTVLVTSGVSKQMRPLLNETFDNVIDVQPINNLSSQGDGNILRSDLPTTFTKIHCWTLLQFHKCVFLDADTIVLHNVDELFEHSELSAVPDPSWPDYFNPGVFTLRPNMETFDALLDLATVSGSLDGTDQTLLNQYFSGWCATDIHNRLSYVYNCLCRIWEATNFDFYTSAPAWVKFGGSIRVGHFAGPVKPWHRASMARQYSQLACTSLLGTASDRRAISRTSGMLAYWWSLFLVLVRPKLTPDMYLGDFYPSPAEEPAVVATECSGDQTPLAPYCPSFTQYIDHHQQQQHEAGVDRAPTPTAFVPYHPEFHEQQWHSLHHGQRTDQENKFTEQHYSYRPPSPPPQASVRSDHHKRCQQPAPPVAAPLPLPSVPETIVPAVQELVLPDSQKESQLEEAAPEKQPPTPKAERAERPVSDTPPTPLVSPSEKKKQAESVADQQPVAGGQKEEQSYSPTCEKCHVEFTEAKSLAVHPPAVAISVNDVSVIGTAKPMTAVKKRSQRRKRRRSKQSKVTKPIQTDIAGELANLKFNDSLCVRHERSEAERMYAWERGEIDYTGADRFENILKQLSRTLRRVGGGGNLPISLDVL